MFKTITYIILVVSMVTLSFAAGIDRGQDQTYPKAYRPGTLIVQFKSSAFTSPRFKLGYRNGIPATNIVSLDRLNTQFGVTKISQDEIYQPRNVALGNQLGYNRIYMFKFSSVADMEAIAKEYEADPAIEFATPDWKMYPASVPNDPLHSKHWGHNNTAQMLSYNWSLGIHNGPAVGDVGFDANAQAAWDGTQGYGNGSVIIGIIDSGVDWAHPDLSANIYINVLDPIDGIDNDSNGKIDDFRGWDFGSGDNDPNDNSATGGHGTCCAGIAAATANNSIGVAGIAAGCRIMALKAADNNGDMFTSVITNAITYGADQGCNVLSMSLGSSGSNGAQNTACNYAWSLNCVVLAATGNENNTSISYPAAYTNVIGVGAASNCGDRKRSSSNASEVNSGVSTDPNGYTCDGERWWGSNYGSTTKDAASAVDIIAPTILPTTDRQGSAGYQSGDYETYFNGTSCSTPYAAGICALIFSRNPSWTATQVRNQLCITAQDIVNVESGTGWDRYTGYGMVNAQKAVGVPTGTFTITSPNGGENWIGASYHNITWDTTGIIESVKVSYSLNSGTSFTTIISSQPNTGSCAWVLPNINSSTVRVRVQDASDTVAVDISDANFTITAGGCPELTYSPVSMPDGYTSTLYNQAVAASGGSSPYTYSIYGGALPPGLTISSSGVISGIPTNIGSYTFTILSVDASFCTDTLSYTMQVHIGNTIEITTNGATYTQSFDGLASSGTSSSSPEGWSFYESGSLGNTTYTADNGTLNTGDTYSYGSTSSSERAFGSLFATNFNPYIGVGFKNNTGDSLVSLVISYRGEQWRLGTTNRKDTLKFQYSIDAVNISSGTWTKYDSLYFLTQTTTGSTGALDGNAVANRKTLSYTLTGMNIPNGATFFFRWVDANASGGDDGLAIDDFSLTAYNKTKPTASGEATPAIITQGSTSLLTATVTPGTGPSSTGITVTGDLRPIGGLASQQFYDDGTHGDALGGNNIFSYLATVPIDTPVGVKTMTLTVSDAQARSTTETISLTVNSSSCPAIVLSPSLSLPDGISGEAYSQTISANGGVSPYSFTVIDGSLPGGLSLAASGVLSGTPSATGTFSFTVSASDSNTCFGNETYTLRIYSAGGNTISLTRAAISYTQNFNTLVSSSTSRILPTGWALAEASSHANAHYTANNGSSTLGDSYSFGENDSTDRALGSIQDANVASTFGAGFTNNTGKTIISLGISFTGEQWNIGETRATPDTLLFQYSTDATGVSSGTWITDGELNFTSPVLNGTAGESNGNSPANQGSVSAMIEGLNIANGSHFYIRWADSDVAGADDGLAIDNFSLTPYALCPTITVSPESLASGEVTIPYNQTLSASGGYAPYTFTVTSGSLPAGLTLSSGGLLSGVPTDSGVFSFTVTATDTELCTGNRTFSLTVIPQVIVSLDVPLNARWNLVSNPLRATNDSVIVLYPGSTGSAFSFTALSGYQNQSTLENGKGYWIKYASSATASLVGPPLRNDSIDVEEGWNLIGSIAVPVAVSAIGSIPAMMETSPFYGYDNGYVVADTIEPGKGYWVKVSESGQLVLLTPTLLSSTTARITIRDNNELPPAPPVTNDNVSDSGIPEKFALEQNYPNPFNPATTFRFMIHDAAFTSLKIYNVLGAEVATLVSKELQPGTYTIVWNADNRPTGLYYYRLISGSNSEVKSMMLVK